jgi:hypothetical protein
MTFYMLLVLIFIVAFTSCASVRPAAPPVEEPKAPAPDVILYAAPQMTMAGGWTRVTARVTERPETVCATLRWVAPFEGGSQTEDCPPDEQPRVVVRVRDFRVHCGEQVIGLLVEKPEGWVRDRGEVVVTGAGCPE